MLHFLLPHPICPDILRWAKIGASRFVVSICQPDIFGRSLETMTSTDTWNRVENISTKISPPCSAGQSAIIVEVQHQSIAPSWLFIFQPPSFLYLGPVAIHRCFNLHMDHKFTNIEVESTKYLCPVLQSVQQWREGCFMAIYVARGAFQNKHKSQTQLQVRSVDKS